MPPKRLLVFCDGTGLDGLIVPGLHEDAPTANGPADNDPFAAGVTQTMEALAGVENLGGGSIVRSVTNVLRLSRAVKSSSSDGSMQQIVFYQSGVGTQADFKGEVTQEAKIMQLFGVIVASKIRDAYAFLAQNFEEGDEILLFGFSRGAYTVRKLSGLIDKIGLLKREYLGIFFNIWKELVDKKPLNIPSDYTRRTRIRCVGVWDTVGAVHGTTNALGIDDDFLPPCVDVVLHAVSLQENRGKFRPTLWRVPANGLGPNQIMKEIWFPGSHSDVGGSHQRHELGDITLFWMAGEILELKLFEIDEVFIVRSKQRNPDPWGTSQPHNSYHETPPVLRPILRLENRLDSGDITSAILLHESWKHAPDPPNSNHGMIWRAKLVERFRELSYAPLNAFEKNCKDTWEAKWMPMVNLPIIYDDITQLFPAEGEE